MSEIDVAKPKAASHRGMRPLVPGSTAGFSGPVVLLVVLGLDEASTARVVDQVAEQGEFLDHKLVFFSDLDCFDPFAETECVIEHMPSQASRMLAPDDLPWNDYTCRRLDLLQTKWRPVATVPFGAVASAALTDWRQSGLYCHSH